MQYTPRALSLGASSNISGGYSSVGRAPDCDSDIHDLKKSLLFLFHTLTINLIKPLRI